MINDNRGQVAATICQALIHGLFARFTAWFLYLKGLPKAIKIINKLKPRRQYNTVRSRHEACHKRWSMDSLPTQLRKGRPDPIEWIGVVH